MNEAVTKQDMENITTQITELTNAMVAGFKDVHERFDGVDARLDGVDTRLESVEKEQETVRTVLDNIADRVDDLWTENRSDVAANRRRDLRLERIEQELGISSGV